MTTTYIWLKAKSQADLAKLKEIGLGKIKFDEKSDDYYIETDIIDPTCNVPQIPEEEIKKVTLVDYIYNGFRICGKYRHDEVEIVVDNSSYHSNGRIANQTINICGKGIKEVKEAYSMVRQGKLSPVENWEKELDELPAPKSNNEKESLCDWFAKFCARVQARFSMK